MKHLKIDQRPLSLVWPSSVPDSVPPISFIELRLGRGPRRFVTDQKNCAAFDALPLAGFCWAMEERFISPGYFETLLPAALLYQARRSLKE